MRATPYTLLYIIADNDLVPIMRSSQMVRWFVLTKRYRLRYHQNGFGVGLTIWQILLEAVLHVLLVVQNIIMEIYLSSKLLT